MSLLWRDFDPLQFASRSDEPQFFSEFSRFPNSSMMFPSSLVSSGPASSSRWLSQPWQPIRCNVDLVESSDQNSLTLRAEMPGVAKEDIQVEVDANRLLLRAEKRAERTEENERYHQAERFYGRIQRQIALPFAVDSENVKANYADGILSVSMQKMAEPGEKKRIVIE